MLIVRNKNQNKPSSDDSGLDNLRFTNSSEEFDDAVALERWRAQRAAFARQAEETYDGVLAAAGKN